MLTPLEPVLGGVVDPDDVVGREDLLRQLNRAVAHGGAYVVGDRRMGKTSILRKLRAELQQAGHIVVSVSAETSSLDTFEEALTLALRERPEFGRVWSRWTKSVGGEFSISLLGAHATMSASGAPPPSAEDVFGQCAEAAVKAGAPSFVLLVDEVAQLAFHLAAAEPGAGEEFLRSLRRLRQNESPRMAVVLSGSVGLHHAVRDTTSLNDAPRIKVGPLTADDATVLAQRLLLSVYGDPHAEAAQRVAAAVDGIPYYLHRIVGELDQQGSDPGTVDFERLVDRALDENAWDTDHYYHRIPKYYPGREHLVVATLDRVAASPARRQEIEDRLGSLLSEDAPASAEVGELLDDLRLDNYLAYDDGIFRFETEFLHRVWLRLRERLGDRS